MNPESETFGMIYESALKAGFSDSYSKCLMSESTGNAWVQEVIKDYKLINLAEKNIETFLNDCKDDRIKADITKWYLARVKKEKYSERTEITGDNGKDLIPDDSVKDHIDKVLDNYFNGRTKGN